VFALVCPIAAHPVAPPREAAGWDRARALAVAAATSVPAFIPHADALPADVTTPDDEQRRKQAIDGRRTPLSSLSEAYRRPKTQ